jgi:hypothetical protein
MTQWGMNVTIKTFLYWLYLAGCIAFIGYEWYSYSGLYRLAAEWQMDTFGSYSIKLTLVLLLVVLIIPGAIIAKLLGVELKGLDRGAPAVDARLVLAAGLVLAAAAAGAGWYGYGKATEEVAFEAFDLSNGKVPPSNHVVMTGVAHPEYLVEFQTKGSTTDRYFPITATNWRPGDPVVYFMKTNATAYMPPEGGKSFEFSRRTKPFRMTTEQSVLIENDLPGPVAEVYRKSNVALAPVPFVVDHPGADAAPYFGAAAVGGVGGIWCLVIAARMAIRRRRQAQA